MERRFIEGTHVSLRILQAESLLEKTVDQSEGLAFIEFLKKVEPVKVDANAGNFNALHNPSRQFMEIFGEWHLNHRSETELIELAIQAGYSTEQISVGRESENINLFLHISP